ncbi:hypothetical protein D3C75_1073770 [compost metagenome]
MGSVDNAQHHQDEQRQINQRQQEPADERQNAQHHIADGEGQEQRQPLIGMIHGKTGIFRGNHGHKKQNVGNNCHSFVGFNVRRVVAVIGGVRLHNRSPQFWFWGAVYVGKLTWLLPYI